MSKNFKSHGDRSMTEIYEAYALINKEEIKGDLIEEALPAFLGAAGRAAAPVIKKVGAAVAPAAKKAGSAALKTGAYEAGKAIDKKYGTSITDVGQENYEDRPAAIEVGAEVDISEDRCGGTGTVVEVLDSRQAQQGVYVVNTDEGLLPLFFTDIMQIG